MQQAVLIEDLQVDEQHQLHIHVPPEMGAQFRVIVMPLGQVPFTGMSDDDVFNLAAYAAVTEENPEEDAIWEEYVRT
jgi:hypothetical protein